MSPVSQVTPVRADARRNRDRLVAAAADLFERDGNDVPLDRIARHAGVGNATLYRNFSGRGELLAAVYEQEVRHLVGLGQAAGAEDPVQALFDWLRELIRLVHDKTALLESVELEPDQRAARYTRWHDELSDTLDALRRTAGAKELGLATISTADLAALTHGIARSARDDAQADRLLAVVRAGLLP